MNPFLSKKFRFYSFTSMVLLVFVHGYNLNNRYLQPWTLPQEKLTVTTFIEYFFANGVFRFRIPMLFVISGYLFAFYDNKPHWQRMGKRARTLLVPYFLWSIIGLLVAVLFAQWSETKAVVYQTHLQPTNKAFGDYSILDWIGAILWPTSFQLWFLRCLFMYNLLYPLLLKGIMKVPIVLFTLFTLMWIATFGIILFEGEGLLFFTVGIWLCKKQKDIERTPAWLNLPLWTFGFLAAAALKTWLAFDLKGLNAPSFFAITILHKITIFMGLVVVWFGLDSLVKFFMEKKWFIHVSAFAFMIYGLHVPIVTYLIDPTFHLLNSLSHFRLITFIFLPIAVILFCIAAGLVLRKTVPKVYSVLTGGRGF